jgi:hypothetical protein
MAIRAVRLEHAVPMDEGPAGSQHEARILDLV